MKSYLTTAALAILTALAAVGLTAGIIWAVATTNVAATSYGRQTTTLFVPNTPVMVMPNTQSTGGPQGIQPGRSVFKICNRGTGSVAVVCWDYSGSTPVATATNMMEIPTGTCRTDGKDLDPVLGLAWACAPEALVTATAIIDSEWR